MSYSGCMNILFVSKVMAKEARLFSETLVSLYPARQQDDETTGVTGVFGGTEPPIYFSSLSSDWLVEACSQ